MTELQEMELVANVKAITDRLDKVDAVFKAAKLGVDMILVFQCNESGLYYPADYVRNWGMPWGDGLGPDVCSESLQSEYDVPPPEISRDIVSLDQIMHPVKVSKAQVDAHLVERSIAEANMAVFEHEDFRMRLRAPILRTKQMNNPKGRLGKLRGLSTVEAAWATKKAGGF